MAGRLPLALAITAWACPIAFAAWAAAELGLESRTAGVVDEVWFAWLGALVGTFAAGAALYLVWNAKKNAIAISALHASRTLSILFLVLTALGSVVLLGRT